MRQSLDGDRFANQIRMRRSTFKGTFIIVEGRSDERFYQKFIEEQECEFSIARGKENAVGAIEILDRDSFPGVLAIVDADFWRLENVTHPSPNLLLTDGHDLEMMMLKSPALEKLLIERCSKKKLKNLKYKDVEIILFRAGIEIAYLRWISLRDRLDLTFDGIEYRKFLNLDTLVIDPLKLIETIKNKSQKLALVTTEIQAKIASIRDETHDWYQLCCGHDIIAILAVGLRGAFATYNANDVKIESLERELRLAYETAFFQETELCRSLFTWETNNLPYRVLRRSLA